MEIRWGSIVNPDDNPINFEYDEDEKSFLAGRFRALAEDSFPHYKTVNEAIPSNIPHIVRHQFWKGDNTWPCIQLGLGIMTVNYGNNHDDYKWETFKQVCLNAIHMLAKSYSTELDSLPVLGIELQYQDGFLLKEGETDNDFIANRALITFAMPDEFINSDLLKPAAKNHHIVFTISAVKPKSILICRLDRGVISGENGFLQSTIVRAKDALCPKFSIETLEEWIEEAHILQRHTYDTLIVATHER